ncbi:MAG: transposase [Terriglobia bacterium]
MRAPSPRRLWKYLTRCLRLQPYFDSPGDGRIAPRIPARALLWSLLLSRLLREWAFHAVEALVGSPARAALQVERDFGDDALSYFTERLRASATRAALAQVLHQAKRHKAFDDSPFMGLAVDGTTVGRCQARGCRFCRSHRNHAGQITGYRHHLVMISVVGTGLTLPFDVEPYGPGDSEYAAGQRVVQRAVSLLGPRFADYVVVDGEFATAPYLHAVGDLHLRVVARLKGNLPELNQAAQQRFSAQPPTACFWEGEDWVEVWDADDFDPWDALRWPTVRVIRYRQYKPNGTLFEAFWLTDFPARRLSSRSLFRLAKSRWEIENQGFNDAKNRYGLEHICHHHPQSLLLVWLITCLALTVERLYRLRYLHRGTHRVLTAIELLRLWRLSLAHPTPLDSS